MTKKILVIGPSGSGKTYISEKLHKKGIPTFDTDEINGLCGWYDKNNIRVEFPYDAEQNFLENHRFLWNRKVLEQFLLERQEAYLFGVSRNALDMLTLFDKVYFLKCPQKLLSERLRHESRANQMGKTDVQLEYSLRSALEIEKLACSFGIVMIDAKGTAEEIFAQISR